MRAVVHPAAVVVGGVNRTSIHVITMDTRHFVSVSQLPLFAFIGADCDGPAR